MFNLDVARFFFGVKFWQFSSPQIDDLGQGKDMVLV